MTSLVPLQYARVLAKLWRRFLYIKFPDATQCSIIKHFELELWNFESTPKNRVNFGKNLKRLKINKAAEIWTSKLVLRKNKNKNKNKTKTKNKNKNKNKTKQKQKKKKKKQTQKKMKYG